MPIGSGSLGILFNMGRMPTTAGMTLVHRNTMNAILWLLSFPLFLFAQMP